MVIREIVLQLQALGRMPDASAESLTDKQIDSYTDLLNTIEKPINFEEAEILVLLFPESGLYCVEWTLLHLFGTVLASNPTEVERYRNITQCPSKEWRETLTVKLNNWLKQ